MVAIRPKVRREKPRFRSSCCCFSDRTVVISLPLVHVAYGEQIIRFGVRCHLGERGRGAAPLRPPLEKFPQGVEGNPQAVLGPSYPFSSTSTPCGNFSRGG